MNLFRTPLPIVIIEEIGFDGLDGITLEGLWTRISIRMKIEQPLNSQFKNHIWNFIKTQNHLEFKVMSVEREILRPIDRFCPLLYDQELGTAIEADECPFTMFEYCQVEDGQIRGSCAEYYTRENVDIDEIRNMTHIEVEEKWGRKFVIVGSQSLRESLLIPDNVNPCNDLVITQYCILERIGRSRQMGEITFGKYSIQYLTKDSKTFYYHRQKLIKNKLIVKQPFNQKQNDMNINGCLLHLPRFYINNKPKQMVLTEKVVEILKTKPNCMASYDEIKLEVGYKIRDFVKKLFKAPDFVRFVNTDLKVPYRTIYPDADINEWKLKNKDQEKQIRVIQLIDPNIDVGEMWCKDEDDEEEEGFLDQSEIVIDMPILRNAFYVIQETKAVGVTQHELKLKLGVHRLHSRTILRNLMKLGYIKFYIKDKGRQRITKYVLTNYIENRANEFIKEESDILDTINNTQTIDPPNDSEQNSSQLQPESEPTHQDMKTEEINNTITETNIILDLLNNDQDENNAPNVSQILNDESEKDNEKVIHNIKIEITETDTMPGVVKPQCGFAYHMKSREAMKFYSQRTMKRINFIIKLTKANLVIEDPAKLLHSVVKDELFHGYKDRICRRSLNRIIAKLLVDKFIKLYSIKMQYKLKTKSLIFICHPSIDENSTMFKSYIDQAKLRFIVSLRPPNVPRPIIGKADLSRKTPKITEIQYGFCPKFIRMRIFHELLFFLIYNYPVDTKPVDKMEAIQHWKETNINIDEDEIMDEISEVYSKKLDWEMFIPPLIPHNEYTDGWALMSDIIVRVPLSIFVKIFNINFEVPGLDEVLAHPLRKHYLLKNIPQDVRENLIRSRKFIFSIDEVAKYLCYIGLLQYGPQRLKEKDQVFIFLNRHATLWNTVTSSPGYYKIQEKEYPKCDYIFNTQEDVSKYWTDMWTICINTRLGKRNNKTDDLYYERIESKASMIKLLEPKTIETAFENDNGYIPGDNCGAAGLDSSLFAHLKRNWNWHSVKMRTNAISKQTARNRKLGCIKPVPITFKRLIRDRESLSAIAALKREKRYVIPIQKKLVMKKQSRRIFRIKDLPKRRARVPFYDEIDRQALKKMNKLRVDWTQQEDSILLLCKVGLMYLVPKKGRTVSYTVIRDILHWKMRSLNKTSRACQRRINYMLKISRATANNVYLCLKEVHQNPRITKRFGKDFVDNLKSFYKNENDFLNALSIHFVDLIALLIKYFPNLTSNKEIEMSIPDNINDFHKEFKENIADYKPKTLLYENPTNKYDIELFTIYSLIHSSMCCNKDKSTLSIQLFEIYKNYPEKILYEALKTIRAHCLLSVNKIAAAKHLSCSKLLPLASHPYHLSISYLIQISTKISHEIIDEYYTKLQEFFGVGCSKSPVELNATNHGICFLLCEFLANDRAILNIEIPKQILILDSAKQNEDPLYEKIYKRFNGTFSYMSKKNYVNFDETKLENRKKVKFHLDNEKINFLMHPIEKLQKINYEYFHVFCMLLNPNAVFSIDENNLCSSCCLIATPNLIEISLNLINTRMEYLLEEKNYIEENFKNIIKPFLERKKLEYDKKDFGKLNNPIKITYPNIFEIITEIQNEMKNEENNDNNNTLMKYLLPCNSIDDEYDDDDAIGTIIPRWSQINRDIDANYKDDLTEKMRRLHECFIVRSSKIFFEFKKMENENFVKISNIEIPKSILPSEFYEKDDLIERFRMRYIWPSSPGSNLDFQNKMQELSFTPSEITLGVDLLSLIEHQGCAGITSEEILNKFQNKELILKILNILLELSIIMRTGIRTITFVYYLNIQPWVINSYHVTRLEKESIDPALLTTSTSSRKRKRNEITKNDKTITPTTMDVSITVEDDDEITQEPSDKRSRLHEIIEINDTENPQPCTSAQAIEAGRIEERISKLLKKKEIIQIRPTAWIRVNGTLNRRVLNRWLSAILLYCISMPGTKIDQICTKFKFLYPVQMWELLEILQEFQCIRLLVLKNVAVSLFSTYENTAVENATFLDSFEEVFVETEKDAIFKLSILLGDKKYKTEFI